MCGGEQLLFLFALPERVTSAMHQHTVCETATHGTATRGVTHEEADVDIAEIVELNAIFAKFLMISIVSYFEAVFKEKILTSLRKPIVESGDSNSREKIEQILSPKFKGAGFFLWGEDSSAEFYRKWGKNFAAFMEKKEEKDSDFAYFRRTFARMFLTRNELVHSNLASFSYNGSVDELKPMYRTARKFIPRFLRYALEFAHQ